MTNLGIDLDDLGIDLPSTGSAPVAAAEPATPAGRNLVAGSTLAKALYSVWSGEPITVVDSPPGAGKTTTVAEMVAHLVERSNLKMVIACPTRRGAADMAERIAATLGPDKDGNPQVALSVKGMTPPPGVAQGGKTSFNSRIPVMRTIASCKSTNRPVCNLMIIDELDRHSMEKLAALKALLPKTKQNALEVGKLAEAGVTPELLKTYGAKLCEDFPVLALTTSKLKPAVLKSLQRPPHARMQELEELAEGGFTKGTDLKNLLESMNKPTVKQLIAARKAADPYSVAVWSGIMKRTLSLDDVKAVGVLARHGYGDPTKIKDEFGPVILRPANELMDREQSLVAVWASVAKAGITPEKLRDMTRAGIPLDRAAKFAKSSDLWTEGAQFRKAIAAKRQRQIDQGWTRATSVQSCAFTEADYQD